VTAVWKIADLWNKRILNGLCDIAEFTVTGLVMSALITGKNYVVTKIGRYNNKYQIKQLVTHHTDTYAAHA